LRRGYIRGNAENRDPERLSLLAELAEQPLDLILCDHLGDISD
jgi:hypothetical protein